MFHERDPSAMFDPNHHGIVAASYTHRDITNAGALRRGDELHVDGTSWLVASVRDENAEIVVTVARRSCGATGTYHLRLPREQPLVRIQRHGRWHVYKYAAADFRAG